MKFTKILKLSAIAMTTVLLACVITSCSGDEGVAPDPGYLDSVASSDIWTNTADTSVPEYQIYKHVHIFLDPCRIENGSAVDENGKTRKVLFLGFDGMRADAAEWLLSRTNEFNSSLPSVANGFSAIDTVRKEGGLYLGYCGGETGTETQQTTSTSASWTSQFTGVWGTGHGIKTNEDSKNLEYKTFMLEFAEKGLASSLAFEWDQFFDVNLSEEVNYVMQNPSIPMVFCDTDRSEADELKDTNAKSLEAYNFVAPEQPSPSAPYDSSIRDWVISRIEGGDDIVCGIFHNIDSAGHSYEFSVSNNEYSNAVSNCDLYAYQVLQVIEEREENDNEEWLVVFANDHGGINQGHGEHTLEERTTWIATNIPFDESLYSAGYDGYNVN